MVTTAPPLLCGGRRLVGAAVGAVAPGLHQMFYEGMGTRRRRRKEAVKMEMEEKDVLTGPFPRVQCAVGHSAPKDRIPPLLPRPTVQRPSNTEPIYACDVPPLSFRETQQSLHLVVESTGGCKEVENTSLPRLGMKSTEQLWDSSTSTSTHSHSSGPSPVHYPSSGMIKHDSTLLKSL